MKTMIHRIAAVLPVAAGLCVTSLAEEAPPLVDPGWPREFTVETKKLTIYQPQINEWKEGRWRP
jgi:hypothetical protein